MKKKQNRIRGLIYLVLVVIWIYCFSILFALPKVLMKIKEGDAANYYTQLYNDDISCFGRFSILKCAEYDTYINLTNNRPLLALEIVLVISAPIYFYWRIKKEKKY